MAVLTSGQQPRRINVLLVTSGLGIGGAETMVRDLARSIDQTRFTVSVCCLSQLGPTGEELAGEGVDIFALGERAEGRVNYLTSLGLRRALRERRIDVMHTHTTHALMDAALCKLMLLGVKSIHTFHFGNYPNIGRRMLWMERVACRLVDRLVAVGMGQRAQIRKTFGLGESRIGLIWNGVDPVAPSADPALRRPAGGDGRILVGTIGSLIEQKGYRDLLEVARRCRDAGSRMRFVVVGDGPLRAELEQLRRQLHVEDLVEFVGLVHNAAARALPALDVFFQPSLWEAMSIAVLEAMAAGKAIVATRVGDNEQMLDAGAEGVLVEPGDVEGMAVSLLRLESDAGLRQRLGEAAAAKYRRCFTLERMTHAYETLYRETLGLREV